MSDLILIEKLDPAVIFSDEEATKIINQITDKVNEFDLSIETAKGRKEISSLAAKVAKSKVLIDEMGKDLVSGWKKKAKEVDVVRKKIRDELDELKVTTRAPLTEWEDNEKERVAKHEENISVLVEAGIECRDDWHSMELEILKNRLLQTEETAMGDMWEEFEHDATVAKSEAIALITAAIEKRQEQQDKDAELEKFRKQAEEDDRKRFEANAKLEAETAARESEIKKNNQLKLEKQQAEEAAKVAQEQAEKNAKLAKEEAEQAIKDAEQKAVKDLEAKQAKEKAEADAREADTKHRGKINREAVKALIAVGMSEDEAKTVISAIARKMIPNVTISY